MTELCERYGVSRCIGYKWLARFNADGKRGLVNRSRRPHTCPTQIRPVLAELLCEFRRMHPDWGARKLLQVLGRRHPEIVVIGLSVQAGHESHLAMLKAGATRLLTKEAAVEQLHHAILHALNRIGDARR